MQKNKENLIYDILKNGRKESWYSLAKKHNINPRGTKKQREKSANDIWRYFKRKYPNFVNTPEVQEVIRPKTKRLFFDIETGYNIVKAFSAGFKKNILHSDIIKERKILCVAYKWENDNKVHTLAWDGKDDKTLLEKFIPIMERADVLVGHNSVRYDTKYIRTRAMAHNIFISSRFSEEDTCKIAKKHFFLNSNKLDYLGQFLGLGKKVQHRGIDMWDDIILHNSKEAMQEMLEYNIQDVILTEKVYHKLMEYSLQTVNTTKQITGESHTCPQCGSSEAKLVNTIFLPSGNVKRVMRCECNNQFEINNKLYEKQYLGVQ